MEQSIALFKGGLLDDFTVMRVNSAWSLAFIVAGGKQAVPLRTDEAGRNEPRTFPNLDDAILAADQVGFDTRMLGRWRPLGPQIARMMASAA